MAAFATDEDTPLTTGSVLANDGDVDGDPITLTQVVSAALLGLTSAAGWYYAMHNQRLVR